MARITRTTVCPDLETYTLAAVVHRAAQRWPDKTALQIPGEEPLTYYSLPRGRRIRHCARRAAAERRAGWVLLPNSARFWWRCMERRSRGALRCCSIHDCAMPNSSTRSVSPG